MDLKKTPFFLYRGYQIALSQLGYWLVWEGWDCFQVPLESTRAAMDFVDEGAGFMLSKSLATNQPG